MSESSVYNRPNRSQSRTEHKPNEASVMHAIDGVIREALGLERSRHLHAEPVNPTPTPDTCEMAAKSHTALPMKGHIDDGC